jgi:hypothetical protein
MTAEDEIVDRLFDSGRVQSQLAVVNG